MQKIDRINLLVHRMMKRRIFSAYRKEMAHFMRNAPESFGCVDDSLRAKHLSLWRCFDPFLTDDWLRLLTKVSGVRDYRFVPSTVYYGVIERCLNNCNVANSGIEDKNLMAFYVPSDIRARCILRYVRGVFFDDNFRALSRKEADELLREYSGDVIGKVAVSSSGGHSVELFKNVGGRKVGKVHELTASWIAAHAATYVVQERLEQEQGVACFNNSSINTCRIMTFRRPWDGTVYVSAAMLRLGCSDDIVDNISSGGASVGILPGGYLRPYGVDAMFRIVDRHPRSGVSFSGFCLDGFEKMSRVACGIAARIPDFNLLGFDMMMRRDGRPCVVEVNATSLCCAEVQMSGPMFGDDTEKLVKWCLDHLELDVFKHIRTWY